MEYDYRLATSTVINIGSTESPSVYEFLGGDSDASLSHRGHLHEQIFSSSLPIDETEVCTRSCSSGSGAPTVSRRRKKPKGFPKRPLSGYNIFFKEERVKVLQEFNAHRAASPMDDELAVGKRVDRSSVSFQDLGKIIGKRWKALSDEDRHRYESLADQDNLRYRNEMDEYNDAKRKRNEEKILRTIVDDIDETTPPVSSNSRSKWNTMVLSRPSEMYASFPSTNVPVIQVRAGDSHLTIAQNSQSVENAQRRGPFIARSEQVFSYPIPPGTEITLPDHQGLDRPYQVQYHFFKMNKRDAEIYLAQLAQTPTVTPYGFIDFPPPPRGAIYLHNPPWNG